MLKLISKNLHICRKIKSTASPLPLVICIAVSLLGCSTVSAGGQKYRVSDAGYATAKKAPAIFHEPLSEAEEDSRRYSNSPQYLFTRKNNDEAYALETQLKAEEAENFVEFRLSSEPELSYIFSFLNDADATLAKYTSNPIFKPNTVKYTAEALGAKSKEFSDALSALYPEYNLANESTIDIIKGKVIAHLSLYEEDFETFPTLDAFRNDPMVELNYNGPLDPAEVLSAEVKPFIRHLAHGPIREPMVIFWSHEGKILLKDGCFYLDDGKRKDQLLIFARRVGVVLDDEGYIALIDRSPHPGGKRTTRVGEPAQWYSGPTAVTDPEILTPLQTACGQHDAVIIGAPSPQSRN